MYGETSLLKHLRWRFVFKLKIFSIFWLNRLSEKCVILWIIIIDSIEHSQDVLIREEQLNLFKEEFEKEVFSPWNYYPFLLPMIWLRERFIQKVKHKFTRSFEQVVEEVV